MSSLMFIEPAESLIRLRGSGAAEVKSWFTNAVWRLTPVISRPALYYFKVLDRLLKKRWPFNYWQGQLVPVSSHTSAQYHSCRPQRVYCTILHTVQSPPHQDPQVCQSKWLGSQFVLHKFLLLMITTVSESTFLSVFY